MHSLRIQNINMWCILVLLKISRISYAVLVILLICAIKDTYLVCLNNIHGSNKFVSCLKQQSGIKQLIVVEYIGRSSGVKC